MKVTLTQTEIEQALKMYMQNVMALKDDIPMKCEFTSTRGPMGLLVEIEINFMNSVSKQEEKCSTCCTTCTVEKPEVKDVTPEPEEVVEATPEEEEEEEVKSEEEPVTVHSLFQNLT